jgi:hypothetical protein
VRGSPRRARTSQDRRPRIHVKIAQVKAVSNTASSWRCSLGVCATSLSAVRRLTVASQALVSPRSKPCCCRRPDSLDDTRALAACSYLGRCGAASALRATRNRSI